MTTSPMRTLSTSAPLRLATILVACLMALSCAPERSTPPTSPSESAAEVTPTGPAESAEPTTPSRMEEAGGNGVDAEARPSAPGMEPPAAPAMSEPGPAATAPAVGESLEALPAGMRCLIQSYPDFLCGGRGGDDAALLWCDGTEMPWDEGRQHADHDDLLDNPNLSEQMAMRYLPGSVYDVPAENFEPGRVRYEPFFTKMYGGTKAETSQHVVKVAWMPGVGKGALRVTTVNHVDEHLSAVSKELEALPEKARTTAASTSGAYNWRNIRGTERLSVHSFGAAVDVGVEVSDFWRWTKPDAEGRYPYKNRFPLEIVEVFERHGFIWGGKWYHYDTMHFEYRPELLHPDCVATPHRDLE